MTAMLEKPADPVEEFKRAVHAEDAPRLRELLRRHPELSAVLDEPLFDFDAPAIVFRAGCLPIVDALLEAGADLNAKSRWWAGGFGALHHVGPEQAARLIERGAVVDAHAAAHLGMLDELRRLVAQNPELVHERGGDGQTPLHFARTPEIAAFLLDHGAAVEARDLDHGGTPAQWTAVDRPEVCRCLLQRGARPDPFMAVALDDGALLAAVLRDNPASLQARVDRKPFDAPGSEGGHIYVYSMGSRNSTPLHTAAIFGRVEMAAVLLDAGLNVNVTGAHDESTPLHAAAWHNRTEMIELLIERGAEVDREAGARHRNTSLGLAIASGSVDAVRLLLECGARVRDEYLPRIQGALAGERGPCSDERRTRLESITTLLHEHGAA